MDVTLTLNLLMHLKLIIKELLIFILSDYNILWIYQCTFSFKGKSYSLHN